MKGNRTKYTPPTCNTLRTHGVCRNPNGMCKRINHPLTYYRRKAWGIHKREEEKSDKSPKKSESSNITTEK
jgi:DNA primase large subunit